jgi:hypothetical protein
MIDQELLSILKKESDTSFIKGLTAQPVKHIPVITQADARSTFLTRYFVRSVNDLYSTIEIDKKQYESFKNNPRFITIELEWKIIGKKETQTLLSGIPLYGVSDTNRIAVADADLTFGGLRRYITDYLEFWIAEE